MLWKCIAKQIENKKLRVFIKIILIILKISTIIFIAITGLVIFIGPHLH